MIVRIHNGQTNPFNFFENWGKPQQLMSAAGVDAVMNADSQLMLPKLPTIGCPQNHLFTAQSSICWKKITVNNKRKIFIDRARCWKAIIAVANGIEMIPIRSSSTVQIGSCMRELIKIASKNRPKLICALRLNLINLVIQIASETSAKILKNGMDCWKGR